MTCSDPNCPICYPMKGAPEPAPSRPEPPKSPYDPDLYYARLRLVHKDDGSPIEKIPYVIFHSGALRESGTTDANGLTSIICSKWPSKISSLMVTPPPGVSGLACCGSTINWADGERTYIGDANNPLASMSRTTTEPAITDVPIAKGGKRGLTTGEEAMARTVFGDGIDYRSVKIHHRGTGLFLGFQDQNTAVTPNGEMYMPAPIYRDDYSRGTDADKRLFMHEMAHVWQYQMDYPVKWKGVTVTSRGTSAYVYTLAHNSRLSDFNMEQQGNIISDYYMICILKHPEGAYNPRTSAELLYKVMEPFVSPINLLHLPNKKL